MKLSSIKEFVINKKLIIIPLLLILALGLLGGILLKPSNRQPQTESGAANYQTAAPTNPPLTQAALLREAIETQKKVDRQYSSWQDTVKNNYPWMKALPLGNEKYFVYFDINKKVFVGKLYPKVTDNVNSLKADINTRLKQAEIPVAQYNFEWKIFPR